MVLAGQPALAGCRTRSSDSFDRAAAAHDVPRDLLVALGYAETHLDGHAGEPSASGGYGVMHLASNPTSAVPWTGRRAHRAAGRDAASRRRRQHPRRAPPCCARTPTRPASTQPASERRRPLVPGRSPSTAAPTTAALARLYADAVYDCSASASRANGGRDRHAAGGHRRPRRPRRRRAASAHGRPWPAPTTRPPPGRRPTPATTRVSSRETATIIDRIVIHVTQGSYAGTISWFQNPERRRSAPTT